jgi:PPK2 family polyphosphate:nucleotide phosphotransferase
MSHKDIAKTCRKLTKPYRISDGSKFRLKDFDPNDTGDLKREDKNRAQEALATGIQALAELQQKLYAHDQWSLLLIFQAMDAAGKDSAIKHVMSGINPQGCQVFSFKAPGIEELDHDYLWRCSRRLPERGRIGIFNRSYYEEVLVVRVHPEFLVTQKLPDTLVNEKKIWKQRFEDIRHYEQYLSNNGTVIRKFFLNVSKKEQKKRFLDRLQEPDKHWKFSARDLHERDFWDDYQNAYEEMIQATATPEAPWYVIPADHKWFTRIIVAAAIVETLDSLKLHYPTVDDEQMKELEAARELLLNDG